MMDELNDLVQRGWLSREDALAALELLESTGDKLKQLQLQPQANQHVHDWCFWKVEQELTKLLGAAFTNQGEGL